jgi:tRNA(Ile)-lysidine synthase
VACSGGADSLALAAAAVSCAPVHGLIVDHGLQPDSAAVAARTAETLAGLGCASVQVLTVSVAADRNVEATARTARYAALREAGKGALVLLGHTMDDQAETVLLGLGRGSGPRSIAGMRELDPPWGRPLLGLRRSVTRDACACAGLPVWDDPHNADPRFRRVRLRTELLPLMEDILAGGVTEALARTAAQLREDCDTLDALAVALRASVSLAGRGPEAAELDATALANARPALRRRVLRGWLLDAGVGDLSDLHLRAVDALVGNWRGQGGVALPGNLVARRAHGRLIVEHAEGEG